MVANVITSCRIFFSAIIFFVPVFSPVFYGCYLAAGFTDMIDGTIARKLGTDGEFGAKLDTMADIVFVTAAAYKILKELNRYRAIGVNRALTIASAGSGKTYLAAFDALNFNPKRLLYIVHEGSILRKSLETFQEVFGKNVSYGIYSGTSKESDADFVFATNITMCKTLELFSKDEFDYIIIDECHHATAETYKKIIGYFEPEFLLGLTATPERLDNQDVFELFDHNVPYELRLCWC